MPDDIREFKFKESDGHESIVKVWCDGREYDGDDEAYRPVYSHSITTPTWSYTDNDIHGGCNETPNLDSGARALFSFLYACQEGMPYKDDGENSGLFPQQVRDWAYHHSDEISTISAELELKE